MFAYIFTGINLFISVLYSCIPLSKLMNAIENNGMFHTQFYSNCPNKTVKEIYKLISNLYIILYRVMY